MPAVRQMKNPHVRRLVKSSGTSRPMPPECDRDRTGAAGRDRRRRRSPAGRSQLDKQRPDAGHHRYYHAGHDLGRAPIANQGQRKWNLPKSARTSGGKCAIVKQNPSRRPDCSFMDGAGIVRLKCVELLVLHIFVDRVIRPSRGALPTVCTTADRINSAFMKVATLHCAPSG